MPNTIRASHFHGKGKDPAMRARDFLAAWIQRCEFTPSKIYEVFFQAALSPDPGLHRRWIGCYDHTRRVLRVESSTTSVKHRWSMEAKNGF
jgi:hypothetical protein